MFLPSRKEDRSLIWYSEEVLRHGISWDCPGHGGFSSPIVADGKVFFNKYRGSGSVLTTQGADTQDPHVSADDEVICTDAATGRTLWKQVFAGKSINNLLRDNPCLHNNTGCYDKGRVYMLGFTWRVYCLDANAGKFIWESHLGEAHLDAERRKQQALEKKAITNLAGDDNKFLSCAGGVIFCNNLRGGIVAFDAETGETRWVAPGSLPTRWVHEGREYILAADGRYFYEMEGTSGITRLVMVDAKTLKPLQTDWWNPPHRQTGGHDYPVAWPYVEGRLFIRGWEGIYCYDLRKATQ